MAGMPMMIFGDGSQTRDFTFVSDTARGILLAGFSNKAVGQTINLGQGSEISINELAADVARVAGQPEAKTEHIGQRPGDVLRLYADSGRAREMLDFSPRVGLPEGLGKLMAWYQGLGMAPAALLEDEIVQNWKPSA